MVSIYDTPQAGGNNASMAEQARQRPGDGPEKVYRSVRQSIIEQALAPGARLPEDALAQQFGVSRTVVRAALERLGSEGLVERINNRSARVASIGMEAAADLLGVRQGLEAMVMRRVVGQLTAEQLSRLRGHVAREELASSLNAAEAVRLAGEFHVLLAEMTGSPMLTRFVSDVVSRSSLILTAHTLPHSSSCGVREHVDLIDLIARGETDAATASMHAHLAQVATRARLRPA
jgi:DNA-binding GntR family transcriptional regulator